MKCPMCSEDLIGAAEDALCASCGFRTGRSTFEEPAESELLEDDEFREEQRTVRSLAEKINRDSTKLTHIFHEAMAIYNMHGGLAPQDFHFLEKSIDWVMKPYLEMYQRGLERGRIEGRREAIGELKFLLGDEYSWPIK
jgi:hypothetical protein